MKFVFILFLFNYGYSFGQSPRIEQAKKLYEYRKYEEARKILTPINDSQSDYAAARYYLGRIAFDQAKLDEAQDYFEEAVDANDKIADYHNWLGNAYGTIAQNANVLKQGILAPKMKSAWEKAVTLSPTMLEPRQSLVQYYLQAPGFMGGSTEKAKETANAILKINPAEGHKQLGNVYVSEKKMAEAEKEFTTMARTDPAYTAELVTFYSRQKQYDKSFKTLDDRFKVNPDDVIIQYHFGRTAAVSGQRLDEGEVFLKKYLLYQPTQNQPSHAGANMRLAQIYEKRGNKADANKHYQAALKLDNNLKEAKEGLERVSK